MTDVILRAFNNYFFEFVDKIQLLFPNETKIENLKSFFELIKNTNPTIIIKVWYSNICIPYSSYIEKGDMDFFFIKDYEKDLTPFHKKGDVDKIISMINEFRSSFINLDETQKVEISKILKHLSQISTVYNNSRETKQNQNQNFHNYSFPSFPL